MAVMTSVTIETVKNCATLLKVDTKHQPSNGDPEMVRLQRANNLDRPTLALIYDDYSPQIYRYIYRQVGDIETSRDLTAEVFHRYLSAIKDRKGPTNHLSAWLYRVAHNIVVDHFRRQQHRQHLPFVHDMHASSEDTGQAAEALVMADQVRLALSRLTPDQQHVIALKFLEGLSNKEVAEITGKPVGAVKSLQHRALNRLKTLVAQTQVTEENYDKNI